MSGISRRRGLILAMGAGAMGFLGGRAFAADYLGAIKKTGTLRVGVDAGFPPFSFRDSSGQITGYDLDLASAFAGTLGVKPVLVDTQWSGIIPSLYAGRFDMIMGGMSYTKERAEKVAFSVPYAEASQALLIRASDKDKVKTIDDMSNRVIGIKLGSPAEVVVKKIDPKLTQDRGKGFAAVKTYDDLSAAYLSLAQGSVDGVMNSIATLSIALRDRPGAYSLVKGVGAESWCAIATRKEDTDLVAFLDDQLHGLEKSGKIYQLQEKWFGFRMPLPATMPIVNF